MASIFLTLLGGFIAAGSAVLAAVVTQRHEMKRWREQRSVDDVRWAEQYGREVDARVYADRRDAVVRFVSEYRRLLTEAQRDKDDGDDPLAQDHDELFILPLQECMAGLDLFAGSEVRGKAQAAYEALWSYAYQSSSYEDAQNALESLTQSARDIYFGGHDCGV